MQNTYFSLLKMEIQVCPLNYRLIGKSDASPLPSVYFLTSHQEMIRVKVKVLKSVEMQIQMEEN